jgi:predicted nucleic-acid-binding protein
MIGIDTNILVRYLTRDDEEQSGEVLRLFEQYSGIESSLYINNIVLCEIIWVLEAAYKYAKQDITNAIRLILQTPEFVFENHVTIVKVLYEYEQSNGADFSDILISFVNTDMGCEATYSFDKKSCKYGYFKELNK